MESLLTQLKNHRQKVTELMRQLDLESKTNQVNLLQAVANEPTFWNDPSNAQKHMQHISRLRELITPWQVLSQRIDDTLELLTLGEDMLEELTKETNSIAQQLDVMSVQAMLSQEHDAGNAILAIHAGAGGVDAQDWAEMLERMYLRWMESNGYKAEVIDRSEGEEAGVKSVTISVKGKYAYGYLKSERGVHRLVRLSPFDGANRRHTSFAKVELWPDIEEDIDIEINEKDLRIDTYRASGAGGQNVQKNDTAVRLTHLPTGIIVQCQNQRSQGQNRDRALQILKAKLYELERIKQDAEIATLKGENIDAGWGQQIRSYVLHPYQLVKDMRTGYEVGNTGAVLDGRISDFMESYLKHSINPEKAN